jgi:chromosome segregation ATPase
VTEHAVRRRIRAGTIETKREVVGNRSRLLVRVDAATTEPANHDLTTLRERVALLDQRVLTLEAELTEVRSERDVIRAVSNERDQRLASVEAERDRLLALLERRRWPGLWPALRRLIYGAD